MGRGRRGEWSSRHPPAPTLTILVRVVASALLHSSGDRCHDVPPSTVWCTLSYSRARGEEATPAGSGLVGVVRPTATIPL